MVGSVGLHILLERLGPVAFSSDSQRTCLPIKSSRYHQLLLAGARLQEAEMRSATIETLGCHFIIMEALLLSTERLSVGASSWSQRMTLHWIQSDPEVCVASQRRQWYLQERGKSLLFQGSSGRSESIKVQSAGSAGSKVVRPRQSERERDSPDFLNSTVTSIFRPFSLERMG